MKHPDVTLENSDSVYDFYLDHQQRRQVARVAYRLLARRYAPRVRYADGAREQLGALVGGKRRLLVAINHVSETDPYTLAATAWDSPLRPIIGRTRVLAKDDLFQDPKQRRRIEMMGSIPVFRGKNHGMRAVSAAGDRMMNVCAERMRRGDDLAVFPEGTCNDGDSRVLQSVGSGIGHITKRARALGVEPTLVIIGFHYGPDAEMLSNASVFIDVPAEPLPEKPLHISRLIADRLQCAVDRAVDLY